jgi:hypothetical protein
LPVDRGAGPAREIASRQDGGGATAMTRSLTTSGPGAISAQEARPLPVPSADLSRPEIDQYLDGDMRPADIVEILEGLSFQRRTRSAHEQPARLLSIDSAIRDFLVNVLRDRARR